MIAHFCREPDDCAYCERRAEVIANHEDWSLDSLNEMADYAAARDYGQGGR